MYDGKSKLLEEGLITYKDFGFQHFQPLHKLIVDIYLDIVSTR